MFQKHGAHEAPEQHTVYDIHQPMGHGMLDQKRDKGNRSPMNASMPQTPNMQQQEQLAQGSLAQNPIADSGMNGSY